MHLNDPKVNLESRVFSCTSPLPGSVSRDLQAVRLLPTLPGLAFLATVVRVAQPRAWSGRARGRATPATGFAGGKGAVWTAKEVNRGLELQMP